MGLDEELMKCLESTECPGFRESTLSRVKNSAYHAQRKSQEMEEVLKFMKEQSQLGSTEEDEHPSMIEASGEYFKYISIEASGEYFKYISRIIELDKKPDSLKELFKSIED